MSNLLEQASLVMIPSGYKEDIVYSEIPIDGSGDLQLTRASDGTRVNSAGLVEVCPWNLIEQSNTFNTTWVSAGPGATITSGQTDPNAGSNAWLLSKLGQTGRIQQTVNVGGVQTFFIYAKKNTSDYILINVFDGTISHECWFNLSTGAVGTQNSSTGAIESVGNGWYKCSVTSTNLIASGIIQIYQSDGNGNVTGASGSIYIFNSQLNIGSTAKPYFPTTDRLNVPRLTYQNGGGGCPSLLLEKQSTNIAYPSQAFAGFSKSSDVSITDNNTISPDGTQNATYYFCNTTTTNGYLIPNFSGASGVQYAVSFYAKAKELSLIYIKNVNDSGGQSIFDLSNGTYTLVTGIDSMSIVAVGNGWYRCTAISTSSTTVISFIPIIKGSANQGVYIWGVQIEQSSYPTSYIVTTSSSATRVADACTKSGIGALIGGTSGTVFFDIKTNPVLSSINYKQFCYYFDSANAQSYLYLDGANKMTTNSNWGSLFYNTALQPNTRYKVALTFAPNDFALYVNGVSVATASSGTPKDNDRISIGQLTGSENAEFVFNQYTHFPSRLTNAELASLTTI